MLIKLNSNRSCEFIGFIENEQAYFLLTQLEKLTSMRDFDVGWNLVFSQNFFKLIKQRHNCSHDHEMLVFIFCLLMGHKHLAGQQVYKSLSLAWTELHDKSIFLAQSDILAYFGRNVHLVGFGNVKTTFIC